ncbi:MAG: DUF1501 domain-containing protein [Planctomycetota bacterium]|nr:MAG: DUF1501 domain-containing protein [Planctomycetota bacterium]
MNLSWPALSPGPPNRREFLRAGALALGGLTLADVLRARAATGSAAHDTSVILFYMWGGPSHLETYDLKPGAPSEYRSVFRPIATSVPGMDICELFPRQAAIADRIALVRSLHHEINIHNDAAIEVLTGKRPSRLDPTSSAKSEHPDFAMIASRLRASTASAMPANVGIPGRLHMTQPTYLGVEHQPFAAGDPAAEDYAPPHLKLAAGLNAEKLSDRRGLLGQLDRMRRGLDLHADLEATDKFREQAFGLLASPEVAEAFDVSRESDATRERYGKNVWGQACLLARRLAEAGTAVVTIYANTPKSGPEFTNWDDHPDNAGRPGHFAGFMRTRLPYMDHALASLVEDIYQRGLDRRVLLVAVGEFGRTPKISYRSATGSHGRDHWPQAYSALLSGGGLRTGQIVGATNSKGEHPVERPLSPQDLLATIYRHLGIDPHQSFDDFSGRPMPILNSGEPIRELV